MDKLSIARRSANMRAIRSRDTAPELTVRRLVHSLGYRYRLHVASLPGRPDLVFSSRRKVIFVHGCFWHQHPSADCVDARQPRSNLGYWQPKLARNISRDQDHIDALQSVGWSVMVVWDCETQRPVELTQRLRHFLDD